MTTTKKCIHTDNIKALRDTLIVTIAYIIPQFVTLVGNVNFGEWKEPISILLAGLGFFANRYLNLIREGGKIDISK